MDSGFKAGRRSDWRLRADFTGYRWRDPAGDRLSCPQEMLETEIRQRGRKRRENTKHDELYSYMKYTNVASYSSALSLGLKK